MLALERHGEILSILNERQFVSVTDLAQELYVSESTIRRDLSYLERNKCLVRTHGGASVKPEANVEKSHVIRQKQNLNQKKTIADTAASFITDGSSMFFDSSTTVNHMIPYLKGLKNLTIVTNGLRTALDLSLYNNITVKIIGGDLLPGSSSIVGCRAIEEVSNFNVDFSFFSCRGFDHMSMYEANEDQGQYKLKIIKNSHTSFLLCDSSKVNQKYLYNVCSLDEIDYIIVDRIKDEKTARELSNITNLIECGE